MLLFVAFVAVCGAHGQVLMKIVKCASGLSVSTYEGNAQANTLPYLCVYLWSLSMLDVTDHA